ncbi:hypothetical protein FE257_006614 [Aspergillus nanangensis]|uniref:Uncharacterized protein n=1 Tax=Aspergillus nanangensis TaxID=2582783 RepID=A0AAD4CXU9_ASPNN|nr:hypothetical protein FE257_006614 [Aspergillus nanangensis]
MASPTGPQNAIPADTTINNPRTRRYSETISDISDLEHHNQSSPPLKKLKLSVQDAPPILHNNPHPYPPPEPTTSLVAESQCEMTAPPTVDSAPISWNMSPPFNNHTRATIPDVYSHPNTPTTSHAPDHVIPLHKVDEKLSTPNLRAPKFIIYEDPTDEQMMDIDDPLSRWDFSDEDKENADEGDRHVNGAGSSLHANIPPHTAQWDFSSQPVRQ